MSVYRCTRTDAYAAGTPGHVNPSARQGHYIEAESHAKAALVMLSRFGGEKRFTVQKWDPPAERETRPTCFNFADDDGGFAADVRDVARLISRGDDGPVTAFVLISRATALATDGHSEATVVAEALHRELFDRGFLR